MKRLQLFLQLFVIAGISYAQPQECGSRVDWKMINASPERLAKVLALEKTIKERGAEIVQMGNNIIYIPVVFHIVLENPTNVTDNDIREQLELLNNCFAGIDSEPPGHFMPFKARSTFRFVLATQTPEGCPSNGITRRTSSRTFNDINYNEVKESPDGTPQWNSHHAAYLNIWIANLSGISGVATFPDDTYNKEFVHPKHQGIVIDSSTLPRFGAGTSRRGKTLAHEIGHYFNLIHIWGDEDQCVGSDLVFDTPNQAKNSSGNCYTGIVTDICSPGLPADYGIMYQNYMDYTDDDCRIMFTNGQFAVMLQSLSYSTRKALVSPSNMALKPVMPVESFT